MTTKKLDISIGLEKNKIKKKHSKFSQWEPPIYYTDLNTFVWNMNL